MKRLEWINEILLLCKPGDILQSRDKYSADPWIVLHTIDKDLLGFRPMLGNREYRIKPRRIKWVIETDTEFSEIGFKHVATVLNNSEWPNMAESLRNAKKLDEN